MSLRLRMLPLGLLAVLVAIAGVLLSGGFGNVALAPVATPTLGPDSGSSETPAAPTPEPTPTPRPAVGGTELYGYLPYWQMTASMATYLQSTPLTTVALFSVTARRSGALNTNATGYRRITGSIGRRLIDEAHARGARVDVVFTSFGGDRNAMLFGRPVPTPTIAPDPGASAATPLPDSTVAPSIAPTPTVAPWHRTVDDLVALAVALGVDGISVDIEALEGEDRLAYGEFIAALRAALVAAKPDARVTVATEAGPRGTGNAAAASAAGADRLFLMGYDYHWSGSQPGASSPVDRNDGLYTLRWSIDQYVEAGVPRDRILLGLPLYGMRWRLDGPMENANVIGSGVVWVPSQHRDVLLSDAFHPGHDIVQISQVVWEQDGLDWLVTFYDSPTTLRSKLALALDNGLAGSGFWAMGYERGLPGYVELMTDFRAGKIAREAAPPRPTPGP